MGESRNVTRRALLGGMAAAGAATLAHPAPGLGAIVDPMLEGGVTSRAVGTLAGTSAPIAAPRRFGLVGVQWSAPLGARIELRARLTNGTWTRWVTASSTGHNPDRGGVPGLFGEPLWTGPAELVQLRSDRSVGGVVLHFVTPPPSAAARAASGFPLARPVLDAGPGQPPIIARDAWAQGQAKPSHAPVYATIDLAFVHHTVNPNGYSAADVPSLLLGIFQYHRFVRGYWDIAYNFLIDLYGRVWEGRAGGIDSPVVGAHAGGYNAESTGVAVLGDFMDVVPSPAALEALERFLAWKLSLHGVPTRGHVTVVVDPASAYYTPFAPGAHVSLPRIAGHRDGDQTDCPGNAFYARLPSIRPRVEALAGAPAQVGLSLPAAGAIAGQSVTVSGRLRELVSARAIAAAPIEVERLGSGGRLTIATATTGADGSWTATIAPELNTMLRALHRSHPATVSDWAVLEVAPAITLEVASAAPLRVTGSVTPAKPAVTVELRRGARTTGKPLWTRRLGARAGAFAGSIRTPRPGTYTLIARTPADADSAAGVSVPVRVRIP